MKYQTIRQVTQSYGISRRMLSYYEEVGLLSSHRTRDYAYRMYDETAIVQLQQIIILRKLQIPVKQIKEILLNQDAVLAIEIFQQNIKELDDKMTAMATLKTILTQFVNALQKSAGVTLKLDLPHDKTMITAIDSLSFPTNIIELTKASNALEKEVSLSLGFDIARNDMEIHEISRGYQNAFGATILSEVVRYGTCIRIVMEMFNIELVISNNTDHNPQDPTRQINGGIWALDDDKFNQATAVLMENAINARTETWEGRATAAFITDKFGVKWVLHNKQTILERTTKMSEKTLTLVTFTVHQPAFHFLGIENKLSVEWKGDFGHFWGNFFNLGGYDNIDPFATQPLDTNIWYVNESGEKVYFQGKIAKSDATVADGYSLVSFPASDYLVLTHEWLPTFDEAQKLGVGFGRKHMNSVQLPEGYERYDTMEFPIKEIERDNADTTEGSRIEHWLPIRKK